MSSRKKTSLGVIHYELELMISIIHTQLDFRDEKISFRGLLSSSG